MAMVQRPNAVGLIICRFVIVEEKTRNVTLVNSFQRLAVEEFPSLPTPFAVYAVLTDGLGDMSLDLIVSRNETLEAIYTRSFQMTFQDPLRQVRLTWQVRSCSFPAAGAYQFGLQAEGEPITQSVLQVMERGING
jgi:hypothetical protein